MLSSSLSFGDCEFIAFDFETTGLDPCRDRLVEAGALRFHRSGEVVDRFESLIHPEMPMPPAAQAIHGITDADLADAPTCREVLPRFLAFLGDPRTTALLAHNACLDAGFLGTELRRAGQALPDHLMFDTLALARSCRPDLRSHRLHALAGALCLEAYAMHRALADAVCVKALWLALDGPRTRAIGLSRTRSMTPLVRSRRLTAGACSMRPSRAAGTCGSCMRGERAALRRGSSHRAAMRTRGVWGTFWPFAMSTALKRRSGLTGSVSACLPRFPEVVVAMLIHRPRTDKLRDEQSKQTLARWKKC